MKKYEEAKLGRAWKLIMFALAMIEYESNKDGKDEDSTNRASRAHGEMDRIAKLLDKSTDEIIADLIAVD